MDEDIAAMDHARKLELSIMTRQKPMNDVIDRGDSAVQQFYRGAVVLVTGGSGFLGKQLIEKLLRSCDISTIYMLLRPKRGKTIHQRLTSILKDPLYDTLRSKKPDFAEKIVPIPGDIAEIRLGLDDKDWIKLTVEVDVIIHMAATVNFDEPLRKAGLVNVRGTREIIYLAKECTHLKLLNHISTAFAHATVSRIDTDVKEQFYPCPVPPDVFLGMVEHIEEARLNDLTPALLKDWPNTYTFTKAIAEEIVRISAADLPVCIVKPPVVTSSFVEPSPGWIDNQTIMSSPIGMLLGAGLGVMHVLLVNKDVLVSYAPVDYVNNAIIAAGWDAIENRQTHSDIPMYTVSTSNCGFKWRYFGEIVRHDDFYRLVSPKSIWYQYLIETNNMFVFWILTWLLHYIPGYLLDGLVTILGVRPKNMPSLVKIHTKVYKLTMVYKYFLWHNWRFIDDNLIAMIERMSAEDRAIYQCDVRHMNFQQLIKAWCIGLRRFIIKDGLQGSEVAYRRVKWLKLANILFLTLYTYVIWRLAYMVYSTLTMIPI